MSDHWNGIANLLGTPSFNPIKKQESGAKSPKPHAEALDEMPSKEAEESIVKPKPEPSRLRSSWDAVAQFFGVASPESAEESSNPSVESETKPKTNDSKNSSASGRRNKPSMWGEPEPEPKSPDVAEPVSFDRAEKKLDEPIRREPRNRGTPKERTQIARRPASPLDSEPITDSDEPDRRSVRRPPRRGRTSPESTVSDMEPSDFNPDVAAEGHESPARRPARDLNTPRSQSPDRERKVRSRDDRPERSDRAERTERTSSRDSKSNRPIQNDAPEDRRPSRTRDDATTRGREQPAERKSISKSGKSPKPAGFGAGLIDDEPEFLFVEDNDDRDEFEVLDDSIGEIAPPKSTDVDDRDPRGKRRRGRGRGKRRDSDVAERDPGERASRGSDSDDSDPPEVARNTRIPSWQEAIGTLVSANMENHQRNPGNSRGSRGRGHGRDRN